MLQAEQMWAKPSQIIFRVSEVHEPEEMITLESTRRWSAWARDRDHHKNIAKPNADHHKNIAKEWQNWFDEQTDDFWVRVLSGQDAQNGQQQEAEVGPLHAAARCPTRHTSM